MERNGKSNFYGMEQNIIIPRDGTERKTESDSSTEQNDKRQFQGLERNEIVPQEEHLKRKTQLKDP